LRLEPEGLDARQPRHLVRPGTRRVDEDRRRKSRARLAGDAPHPFTAPDRRDTHSGMQNASSCPQLPKIALPERVRIEADAFAVCNSVERILLQQRAKLVDSGRIEPLELGECR